MEVIEGLLAVTVLLVLVIAAILAWAVRSGQFDDLEGPAWRVLLDDDDARHPADPDQDADRRRP